MGKEERLVQLMTPEGEALARDLTVTPWEEYPRPHMERESYFTLNGAWEFSEVIDGETPDYRESIRVPFVPESVLSGIGRRMKRGATLCYRKKFSLPQEFVRDRVLLQIGAADQIARVVLNGTRMGTHVGGYEPFSFDITDTLQAENVLEIFVTDELDTHVLPYGKQREDRGGMWYTPVSGIWQSVWLESVPKQYITAVSVTARDHTARICVEMNEGSAEGEIALIREGGEDLFLPLRNGRAEICLEEPRSWSPEDPYLYRFAVRAGEDTVRSYFAFRTVEIKEVGGKARICLNGKPYFFHGLLDQGYFPDGIFLPAAPSGYERDILAAKKFGFNMLRKHIKVEPECFYYACDRLGMVVFQDMVNNGDYRFFRDTVLPTVGIKRMPDKMMHRDGETRAAFLAGMEGTVRTLSHHPSVCYWTIFNEGWGQFDHVSAYKRLRELDPTRPIDSTSGWFSPLHQKDACSDVESLHVYFKPFEMKVGKKPIVLSEFGGYSYKVEGHCFNLVKNYGYRTLRDQKSFMDAFEALYREQILPAVGEGLCATVYTQLTDVEDETNGILTYDRRVEKVDQKRMLAIAEKLFEAIE